MSGDESLFRQRDLIECDLMLAAQVIGKRDQFTDVEFQELGRAAVNPQRELAGAPRDGHHVVEPLRAVEQDRQLWPACGDLDGRLVAHFKVFGLDDPRLRIDLLATDAMECLHGLSGVACVRVDVLRMALVHVVEAEPDRPVLAGRERSVLHLDPHVLRESLVEDRRREVCDRFLNKTTILVNPLATDRLPVVGARLREVVVVVERGGVGFLPCPLAPRLGGERVRVRGSFFGCLLR